MRNYSKRALQISFVLLVTAILGTTRCQGQKIMSDTSLGAKFDQLLTVQFKPDGPGCAALVARKGKIIYKNALGKANLELGVTMQPDMIFRIGSITKQFTAVAILQLEESGKLSLSDEITRFIPDYPVQGNKITIEHLLTHTSGIKSYTEMKEWDDAMQRKDYTPAEMMDFFKNQPLEFTPGTRFKYNNSGFFLLGIIIGKASGMSYEKFLEENIFKPLGMEHTRYDNTSALIPQRIPGYTLSDQGFANADYLSLTQPYAAGSLISTVGDLYKWNQGIHSGKIIKKETLDKAFIPYKLSDGTSTGYGYGWGIGEINGSRTISHGGGINGFLTHAIYLPGEDVFVAIFSNCDNISPENTALKMAALTIGKSNEYTEISLDTLELKKYVGVYENNSTEQRIISYSEGQLYSLRTGGSKNKIFPYGKELFFFKDGMATYEFLMGKDGGITGVKFRRMGSETSTWQRTDKAIPTQSSINLEQSILDKYVGEYELAPGFTITVSHEGEHLMARATGQEKFELFAEAPDKFFLKVVDARLEFFNDQSGQVVKLILYQNGAHEGKKIH